MATNKSGFHYLGIGCLIVGILLVVGGSIFGWMAWRWGKTLEKDLEDPAGREERVLATLRGSSVPEGYHPMLGLRIPLLLEVAMLTDEPLDPGEEVPDLGEKGFIYVAFRNFGRDREELEDFFAGRTEDPHVLERHDINIDAGQRLANGRIERETGPILWVAHEGEVGGLHARGRHRGLMTLLKVSCGDDSHNRIGILFGPRAEEIAGDDSNDVALKGTVADAEHITDFVSHFAFCPE